MNENETYLPQIVGKKGEDAAYGTMLVEVHKCPLCKRWMLEANPFSKHYLQSKKAQMDCVDWVSQGDAEIEDAEANTPICIECEAAGKATFVCILCGKTQKTSEIEKSFGYPAEHFCKTCYAITPAKEWDENVEKLHVQHRWDFE